MHRGFHGISINESSFLGISSRDHSWFLQIKNKKTTLHISAGKLISKVKKGQRI